MAYTHQVNFDKVFVSGLLEGRRYTNDYLRFCSLDEAKAYAAKEGQTLNCCAGTGAYRMEDPIISELE